MKIFKLPNQGMNEHHSKILGAFEDVKKLHQLILILSIDQIQRKEFFHKSIRKKTSLKAFYLQRFRKN
jgi:hypothetical protein